MKKLFLSLLLGIIFLSGSIAQVQDPVSWGFKSKKTGDNEYELIFSAEIDPGWHLYSAFLPEGGPIPTSFSFTENSNFKLIDSIIEVTHAEEKFDESFGLKLSMFSKKAVFKQKVLIGAEKTNVKGYITFMSCDDEQCLPPRDVDFSFELKGTGEEIVQAKSEGASATEPKSTKENGSSRSLLGFFFLSLAMGLAGILTPCVFPMIPMTVSFFMQGGKKSTSVMKGVVFGLSIVLIYTAIGFIVSLTQTGADMTNTIASNWIINLIFSVLFFVFAASFFGMFEIVLPTSLANKADKQVDKGGMLASFFMAITFVIVSFSCTGPFVASLLMGAMSGEMIRPILGMFGFSFALALPFTLMAIFPSLLKKMPKSGGWMNSVKVVFAFLLIAFGMKYLMPVDRELGLNLLTRDTYLAIWIVLFTLLGMYLLGKIKFSHDSDLPHISVPRFIIAIVAFSFAVYMVPGLFGAELKSISALIPPKDQQEFDLTSVSASHAVVTEDYSSYPGVCEKPKYADKLHFPHGLKGYFDYVQGMACAKELNKPVLLDFKGHYCGNCKKMDSDVWSNPEVLKRLKENFVIIGLYTDDNTDLPEDEWVTSSIDGKVKKTMGKKNLDFEITKYNSNAQPLYVIVDHNGNNLVEPRGFNKDIEAYIKWLDEGAANFKK